MTEPAEVAALESLGVMSLGILDPVRLASLAESLGYRSVWVPETTGYEAFATLAAAGAVTSHLDLCSGVIPIQLRTPVLLAMGGATLQSFHPDRDVVLGVGISSPVVTERWHGVPYGSSPLARMREYLTLVRECLSGESVTFKGDFYEVSRFRLGVRLGERRPRLVIGALNEGMLRLAGEVADGVLLNYLPASRVAWSVEQVRAGEARGGRPPGSCTVYAYVHVGVCDRADGIDYARRDLFSYAVVDSYARSFELAGFAEEVAEIRARHEAKDREGALAAVTDRFIDAIDIMGDEAGVRDAVRSYVRAGVDVPVIMPLPWGPDRWAVIEATLEACAARSG
ncbi:MAG: LLM class F420-dependent oxidoreductase [Actinobacteria bacterium]|nr:MAG: LLM class F420-dependent oxidoreductase [Actinomycetota bacterium]RIK08376.1 MAG: hypothetical protein DCC48_00005 [Acidobacteriota bacterium]